MNKILLSPKIFGSTGNIYCCFCLFQQFFNEFQIFTRHDILLISLLYMLQKHLVHAHAYAPTFP